jgi:hypothetical protein
MTPTRWSIAACAVAVLMATGAAPAGAQQPSMSRDTTASFVGLVVRQGTLVPIPNAMAVLLGGKTLGGSNDSGYFTARGLPPGKADVLVRVSGFQGMKKTIDLRPGVVDTVQFELSPAQRKPPKILLRSDRR